MKQSRASLVKQLENRGLRFLTFSLTSQGAHLPEDAIWNYKDVPHLHYVHKVINDTPSVIEEDIHAYFNMMQLFRFFKIPLTVLNYQSGPKTLTYYTTWMFFILIIESNCELIEPGKTEVTTTYSIGANPLLKWFLPLIRWLLRRNYLNLMEQDIPMRSRRGQLRLWGYQFKQDSQHYSFSATTDVMQSNVICPAAAPKQKSMLVPVYPNIPDPGEIFIGQDDHMGLKIVRSGNSLRVYPRFCPHEGASLDECRPENEGHIRCPWHGRAFRPLASFDLSVKEQQRSTNKSFHFTLKDLNLTIEFLKEQPQT